MDDTQGNVTVSPSVLTTIVRLTALEQRGVNRMAPVHGPRRGFRAGSATDEGIFVGVTDEGVHVEVHLIADASCNMLKLGETLQADITRAVEEMAGMPVKSVDVHIEGVHLPHRAPGP